MTIELSNITITYQYHPAIHHLNTSIEKGSLVAIVGPNGAGKSTLLNAIAGLTEVDEGSISGFQNDEIAYLPQRLQIDKSFPMTVEELVSTGLWPISGFSKSIKANDELRCLDAIKTVGLNGFEKRMINTLSGGQLQRALFARVIVQNLPVIILDEPFNAIDEKTIDDLTRVVNSWHAQKRTIIMVTHDLDYVRKHCPQTLLLARECIAHGLTHETLIPENLNRAKLMSEAFDETAPWCEQDHSHH